MSCGTIIFWVIVVICVLGWLIETFDKSAKAAESERLQRENPELWVRLQELEHMKAAQAQQMELEQKKLKHAQVNQAVNVGMHIARWFMR